MVEVFFEEHPAMSRKLPSKRDPNIIREITDSNVFFMSFYLRCDLTENF